MRYYEVSEEELEKLRNDFKNGRLEISIEEDVFNMHEYNQVGANPKPQPRQSVHLGCFGLDIHCAIENCGFVVRLPLQWAFA